MSWRPPGPQGDHHSGPGFSGRNRQSSNGGPSGVQRSSAAQLREHEPLFTTYEHLAGLERGDAALTLLRKVASMVKPIMQKHNWCVQVLAEFLPPEQNLLGLNINRGYKICLRLRYHNSPDLFLPMEEILDTLLHELCHNVWSEHDSNFHKLWDELRDEHEMLLRKGYTGEGFLGSGKRLGGSHGRMPPPHEMRRLAKASAEKRKAQGTLMQGSGQRLGGTPFHMQGNDVRKVIADSAIRRNTISRGCASGRKDADKLSQASSDNTFKTKAEEDDANNRAIAQALYELMEQEEEQKLYEKPSGGGLQWSPEHGLYDSETSMPGKDQLSEEDQLKWAMEESTRMTSGSETPLAPPIPFDSKPTTTNSKSKQPETKPTQHAVPTVKSELIDLDSYESPTTQPSPQHPPDQWACEVCTCINPLQFLSCDACGIERPQSLLIKGREKPKPAPLHQPGPPAKKIKSQPMTAADRFPIKPPDPNASLGWMCRNCTAFMEHKWWTCSACGMMKPSS